MTAGDLAAVLVSVLALAAAGALVAVLLRTQRTLVEVRDALARIESETLPMVDEMALTVRRAGREVDRIEDVVGSAEAISARVDGASRIATAALSRPVIKTVAVATGTSRAAKRLRKGS